MCKKAGTRSKTIAEESFKDFRPILVNEKGQVILSPESIKEIAKTVAEYLKEKKGLS